MKSAAEVVNTARTTFESGVTKPHSYRIKQLNGLLKLIENNEKALTDANIDDTKKPKFEAVVYETNALKNKIKQMIYHLEEWMKPVKPEKPLPFIFDQVLIKPEPYGVVLVIGAWNYPLLLVLEPLAGAIAAGNTVVVKPSEFAPKVAKLLEDLIPTYLDSNAYHVYNGGVPETTQLLEQRYDYIFYTGNSRVGKIVHAAASKHLTPCTFELGGKSPTYIDYTADLDLVAHRVLFGRLINGGQSCIAPDYILCTKEIQERFIKVCKKVIQKWFGDDPRNSKDFARIIHDNSFNRIVALLKDAEIAHGGSYDIKDRYIEPTIIKNAKGSDPVMQDEIFGPVLPIVPIKDASEAIKFINEREKPLALYVFSKDKEVHNLFLENTSSGNMLINDTMMHFSCDTIPFGGVGNSGMGGYHGKFTFDTFSHYKGTVIKSLNKLGEILNKMRYPPYSDKNIQTVEKALKFKPPFPGKKHLPKLLFFGLGMLTMAITKCACKYLEWYQNKQ